MAEPNMPVPDDDDDEVWDRRWYCTRVVREADNTYTATLRRKDRSTMVMRGMSRGQADAYEIGTLHVHPKQRRT